MPQPEIVLTAKHYKDLIGKVESLKKKDEWGYFQDGEPEMCKTSPKRDKLMSEMEIDKGDFEINDIVDVKEVVESGFHRKPGIARIIAVKGGGR